MRIYIISDNKDKEIALANIIARANHSPIMSELSSDDYNEMVGEALDNLKSGHDMMVIISSDAVDASIEANRTGKLRALVCNSADDAAKAKRAGVNLIIIDSSSTKTTLNNVVAGLVTPAGQQPARREQVVERPQQKPVFNKVIPQRKPVVQREEEDEDATPPPKEGGIVKKLKYHFGLD